MKTQANRPDGLAASAGSAFLRINYGINRRLRGRRFEHQNGKMRVNGDWSDNATHEKIIAIILRRHPGWRITGWCPAPPKRTKACVECLPPNAKGQP